MSAPRAAVEPAHRPIGFVLIAGLVLTALVLYWDIDTSYERSRAAFNAQAERVRGDIAARQNVYAYLIEGAARLFGATPEISPAVFHAYVDGSDLQKHFPGIQGVGFTRLIDSNELAAFEHAQQQAVKSDYRVWPPGARAIYAPVTLVEPLSERNQRALGYDMYSEPLRRAAMDAAARDRAPRLTARVVLVRENPNLAMPGFLLYTPLFEQGPAPQRLRGFVYIPFRAGDFFDNLLLETGATCDVEVYDTDQARPDTLLYSVHRARDALPAGQAPAWVIDDRIEQFGRVWRVRVFSDITREGLIDRARVALVTLAGLILTAGSAAWQWRKRKPAQ